MLNAAMLIFNLFVPAYPLDGGRILAALLVKCGTPVRSAARITSVTAMCIAALMIAYGVYGLALGGDGGSGAFTLLIGAWILFTSFGLYRLVQSNTVQQHPMFNKPCYTQRNSNTQNPAAAGNINTGAQNVTAETAEATSQQNRGSIFSLFGSRRNRAQDGQPDLAV